MNDSKVLSSQAKLRLHRCYLTNAAPGGDERQPLQMAPSYLSAFQISAYAVLCWW